MRNRERNVEKTENLGERLLGILFLILGALMTLAALGAWLVVTRITVTEEPAWVAPVVLASVGIPFFMVGLGFVIAVKVMDKKKNRLLQHGKKIYAEVTGSQIVYQVAVNGRHPNRLECRYTDEFTGDVFLYSSRNIFGDTYPYVGQQVAVYVNPDDPADYYVDVDSLRKEEYQGKVHDFRS